MKICTKCGKEIPLKRHNWRRKGWEMRCDECNLQVNQELQSVYSEKLEKLTVKNIK